MWVKRRDWSGLALNQGNALIVVKATVDEWLLAVDKPLLFSLASVHD